MAAPLFTSAVNKFGKVIFRRAGRFISQNAFLQGTRRIQKGLKGAGQFISRQAHAQSLSTSGVAQRLMAEIGPPLGGGDWVSRVRKSAEKFVDLLGDANQLG